MINKRRSREQIACEILEICRRSATKTRIVYGANLNFRSVEPYLGLLQKNNLLTVSTNPGVRFEATAEGLDLLERFRAIQKELDT